MVAEREDVLIFANGIIDDTAWIAPYLAGARALIAADGGMGHLLALGRYPDVLIGDLDSLPEGVESALSERGVEVIRHSPDKDQTDLELALLHARGRFPQSNLLIFGGFGGRLDHTLANVFLLAHPDLVGHPVRFVGARESVWLVDGQTVIAGRPGDTVSLIPLGRPARVAETTGLRWPLRQETLDFGAARGVSNEMTADRATVRLDGGLLLCVHMPTPPHPD